MDKLTSVINEANARADELAVVIERAEIDGKDVPAAHHALTSLRHALAQAQDEARAVLAELDWLTSGPA